MEYDDIVAASEVFGKLGDEVEATGIVAAKEFLTRSFIDGEDGALPFEVISNSLKMPSIMSWLVEI